MRVQERGVEDTGVAHLQGSHVVLQRVADEDGAWGDLPKQCTLHVLKRRGDTLQHAGRDATVLCQVVAHGVGRLLRASKQRWGRV